MSIEKAMMLHRQGKVKEAEDEYLKVLEDKPNDLTALSLLGAIYFQSKKVGLALQLFQRAVDIHPEHYEALNNLGNCHKTANRDKEAKEAWERALRVPERSAQEYSDIWNNLGIIHINAGTPGEGMPYIEKALKLKPDHPDANWNLALLHLEQGHYGEGFDRYEWGFKTKHRLFRQYENIPAWDGSEGKNVIVWGEQGIGDEIMFASMIPDLIKVSKSVIFDCHPRLVKIFQESFPGLPIHGTRKDNIIGWFQRGQYDAKLAIGDLGRFFRRNVSDFPNHAGYLKASDERVAHYRKKLDKIGSRLKVGISWTGGYKKTRKDYRSIPLSMWKPILECDADFISLQYTPDAYESVAQIEDEMDVRIHHWPSSVQNDDYHETAALVSALDMVITVNTAAHHLTGALGKECWTMTPKAKAWRYWSPDEDGQKVPWYPSVRQFQQKCLFDWNPIIGKVSRELRKKIRERNAAKLIQAEMVAL